MGLKRSNFGEDQREIREQMMDTVIVEYGDPLVPAVSPRSRKRRFLGANTIRQRKTAPEGQQNVPEHHESHKW